MDLGFLVRTRAGAVPGGTMTPGLWAAIVCLTARFHPTALSLQAKHDNAVSPETRFGESAGKPDDSAQNCCRPNADV